MGSQPRKSCLWFWWTLQARPVFRSPHSLQGVPTNIHSFTSFKVLSALHCDKSLGVFRAIARSDAGIKSCSTEFRVLVIQTEPWAIFTSYGYSQVLIIILILLQYLIIKLYDINLLLNIVIVLKYY